VKSTRESAPQTWMLRLAYDGTDYRGWQVQPGQPTIQGELQSALERITGEAPLPQGSGRTDAGVHALAQVASFALRAPIPAANLLRALNRTLPDAIRVLEAQTAPDGFHARHSARAKTYEYRILLERSAPASVCSPFLARYVYTCRWKLNFAAMQRAAEHFLGEHDFVSFAATDPDVTERQAAMLPEEDDQESGAIRTIFASDWQRIESDAGEMMVYRVRGNGFVHHMVRNLVGTMVEAGRGALQAEDMASILRARDRAAAGPTAPARGLFLHSVEYDDIGGNRS
jgi:tRNA pseudouridine38-40 synthase